MKQATITINGRLYDALSGNPIVSAQAAPAQTAVQEPVTKKVVADIARPVAAHKPHQPEHPATAIHAKPERPKTLNRLALKKPQVAKSSAAQNGVTAHHSINTGTKSPLISRFKPVVIAPAASSSKAGPEATSTQRQAPANTTPLHPSVLAAMQAKSARAQAAVPQNSKQLKEMLIKERLAEVGNTEQKQKIGLFARKPKLASILASSLSLLLLAGYFTYINLTNISMRVAAGNAGINASFPGYKPDGYSLNGPITYAPGEVSINYRSNTSGDDFTLTQKASSWDSQGVLDNYVRKQTSTYLTFQQRGVTVYTFNNKAAWTNGGLLYTIEGDATLSSDQILRLATSL